MKRLLTLMKMVPIMVLLAICGSSAQTVVTIGNTASTTSSSYPFYTFYHDSRGYILITAAEMNAAGANPGNISKVGFDFLGIGGMTMSNFQIGIANTSITALTTANASTIATTTYYGPTAFTPGAIGWTDFTLTNDFIWDGSSNVVVMVCFDNDTYTSAHTVRATTGTTGYFVDYYQDGGAGCTTAPANTVLPAYRPNIRFTQSMPVISELKPAEHSVLQLGSAYSTADAQIHPSFVVGNYTSTLPGNVKYKIYGPGTPTTNIACQTVYEALVEGTTEVSIPITSNGQKIMTEGRGLIAKTTPANNGELSLLGNPVEGGVYTVEAEVYCPTINVSKTYSHTFNIALERDIAVNDVEHPKLNKKYEVAVGRTNSIINIQNVGSTDVTAMDICANYFKKDASGNWAFVQTDTVKWRSGATLAALSCAQTARIVFPDFFFNTVGDYKVEYLAIYRNLQNPENGDMDLSNNVYPRGSVAEWTFNVANSVELEVSKFVEPNTEGEYFSGVPIRPIVNYFNSGTVDTNDVSATISFYKLNEFGAMVPVVTNIATTIADLVSNATAIGYFGDFTPTEAGTYVVESRIIFPGDPSPANNVLRDTFYVIASLSGEYTVGTRFANTDRNFNTLKDVENALMYSGIAGPVEFQLTDASYVIGSGIIGLTDPAIDLSSKIVGSSETNTIKFVPHRDRYYEKNSIVINIQSPSGIGFYIAQNPAPTNNNAAINRVTLPEYKARFANPANYVTFDGGDYKSIRFNMNTESNFRAAIYLGAGASNITVKNCLFTDNSPVASTQALLPMARYNMSMSVFEFQEDVRNAGSYSTAILQRAVLPSDEKVSNMDSLACTNNIFQGNEISDYSFGIVSIGMGVLIDAQRGILNKYYNTNNQYTDNLIDGVHHAGIYLGFEENSAIKNNVIVNIDGASTSGTSAGIMLGGEANNGYTGYNVMGITVDGNEINNIAGADAAYGIKVEEYNTQYPVGNALEDYPDTDENLKIINNIIWGISTPNAAADRYGIRVYSTRADDKTTAFETAIYPLANRYKVRGTLLANNTVVIENDSYTNTGALAGVAIQNVENTRLYSNAIAFNDNAIANANNTGIAACVFYEGLFPTAEDNVFDRNAFEVSALSSASVYRFIETDDKDRILELGLYNDYQTIHQWRHWTFMDMNSAQGNFTQDMTYSTVEDYQILRVQSNPAPLSSILNNVGQNLLEDVLTDIDGNVRGQSGQRYDIGACEFVGLFYSEDLSVENILSPSSYKTGTGVFADAEYIMQTPPYQVNAVVRNNGTLPRSNVPVQTTLYMQMPDGTYSQIDQVEQNIALARDNSINVINSFPTNEDVLFPRSFEQLRRIDPVLYNYNVPERFEAMKEQVTPLYKIKVEIILAESRTDNDSFEKTVRYYVPRTNISMLVSGENMATDITNTLDANEIAGRLNADSLKTNMARLGWRADVDSAYCYDVFDRAGWEPRAVDYTIYRTMFWSDGNENPLTRYEAADIRNYLNNNVEGITKRNLIIGSQEMAREMMNLDYAQYDTTFVLDVLRARPATPATPLVDAANNYQSYSNNYMVGTGLVPNRREKIIATGFANDEPPYPGRVDVVSQGDAVSLSAYRFETDDPEETTAVGGVISSGLTKNLIYLGVDWRHWGSSEVVLQAIYDYILRNGGTFVPVELTDFEAMKFNNRVELAWTTAYELNSDRFEVEKAIRNEAGMTGNFAKINEVAASNISSVNTEYGPVKDYSVKAGNTYVYRLKMIDRDGSYNYSNEVEVTYDYAELQISNVTPNPVNSNAVINLVAPQAGNLNASIYDAAGNIVKTVFNGNVNAGAMSISFDAAGIASGAYTLMLTDGKSTVTAQIRIAK